MNTYQRVLTIQDISCVGQCSLTVALPILSACGVETGILPSAVLSTHTGGFTGYTFRDLTDDMTPILEHWKKENIRFDEAVQTWRIAESDPSHKLRERPSSGGGQVRQCSLPPSKWKRGASGCSSPQSAQRSTAGANPARHISRSSKTALICSLSYCPRERR